MRSRSHVLLVINVSRVWLTANRRTNGKRTPLRLWTRSEMQTHFSSLFRGKLNVTRYNIYVRIYHHRQHSFSFFTSSCRRCWSLNIRSQWFNVRVGCRVRTASVIHIRAKVLRRREWKRNESIARNETATSRWMKCIWTRSPNGWWMNSIQWTLGASVRFVAHQRQSTVSHFLCYFREFEFRGGKFYPLFRSEYFFCLEFPIRHSIDCFAKDKFPGNFVRASLSVNDSDNGERFRISLFFFADISQNCTVN